MRMTHDLNDSLHYTRRRLSAYSAAKYDAREETIDAGAGLVRCDAQIGIFASDFAANHIRDRFPLGARSNKVRVRLQVVGRRQVCAPEGRSPGWAEKRCRLKSPPLTRSMLDFGALPPAAVRNCAHIVETGRTDQGNGPSGQRLR
jgi:hypothetical protein